LETFKRLPATVNSLRKSAFKVIPAGEDLDGVSLNYAKFCMQTSQTPIPKSLWLRRAKGFPAGKGTLIQVYDFRRRYNKHLRLFMLDFLFSNLYFKNTFFR
jgi:hypothetical protein